MPTSMTPAQVLAALTETPQRIARVVATMTEEQLITRPSPDAWSAVDVLAHLRCCSDCWGGCMEQIVAQEKPTIRAVNPTTYQLGTDYATLAFSDSWSAHREQRAALVGWLSGLPDEAWLRTASVTGAGRPLERTVLFYASWLARHERSHVKQLTELSSRAEPKTATAPPPRDHHRSEAGLAGAPRHHSPDDHRGWRPCD